MSYVFRRRTDDADIEQVFEIGRARSTTVNGTTGSLT